MGAPSTSEDLLALLDKSRLLASVDFNGYLRQKRDLASVPELPGELADLLVQDGLLTRFQADNLLQGKWMRYFIGPYKVLEALGAGSSGIVYLCEHDRMRRRVAIKVLQGDKARDRKSLERFYREARAAATLDHPNIVRAFDVGQEERFHYLVMEYVDGITLRQVVKTDGPLSATRAADYLRQAALGLRHAHESGLVHRDVKPTNLMVDRQGVIKILDLGLALFFEDGGDVLTQGAVLGNADFIAPEQALDSHSVDIRADIYSLGATFWYCLTGSRIPRNGMDSARRLGRQGAGVERTDVPDGLWDVLRKMMAKDPAERYQTPSEVVEAVSPWVPDEVTRLLLIESPPPEPTLETTTTHAMTETVPDLPAAPAIASQAPVAAAPPPRVTASPISLEKRTTPRRRRPLWLVAGALTGLMILGAVLAWRTPARVAVPGRGPESKPYFRPVSPHSP
jgi:eukaryotic-like serine/threonine-protein kinase